MQHQFASEQIHPATLPWYRPCIAELSYFRAPWVVSEALNAGLSDDIRNFMLYGIKLVMPYDTRLCKVLWSTVTQPCIWSSIVGLHTPQALSSTHCVRWVWGGDPMPHDDIRLTSPTSWWQNTAEILSTTHPLHLFFPTLLKHFLHPFETFSSPFWNPSSIHPLNLFSPPFRNLFLHPIETSPPFFHHVKTKTNTKLIWAKMSF